MIICYLFVGRRVRHGGLHAGKDFLTTVRATIPVEKQRFSDKATKTSHGKEKRKNKHKICLRKKLVDAVKYLLPHTPATEACIRLEDVYHFDGRKSQCLRDIGRDLKKSPPLPKYFEKYPL